MYAEVVPRLVEANADRVILTATNPVDVLAYQAWQRSGLPPERVIGSGMILDSARFRFLLGHHLGVDPRSVHAFIAGEHEPRRGASTLDRALRQRAVPPDEGAT